MAKLTIKQYEQQVADCDGLCIITDEMLTVNRELMKCVRCPFCHETVDAILTPSTIRCPKCTVEVRRG